MCVSSFFHSLCSRLLQGAFFCTTYGQSDHTPDRGAREDQEAVKAGAPLTWPLPRAARDWRRGRDAGDDSRFGDSDVVRRTVEAQAAEAALDVMAGLSLGAVVGAQRALVQVYGEQRVVGGFTGALGAWVSEQLVLWVHSSHAPTSATLDSSQGPEPLWGWHRGGRLGGDSLNRNRCPASRAFKSQSRCSV